MYLGVYLIIVPILGPCKVNCNCSWESVYLYVGDAISKKCLLGYGALGAGVFSYSYAGMGKWEGGKAMQGGDMSGHLGYKYIVANVHRPLTPPRHGT